MSDHDELKQFLGTDIVRCETCNKAIEISKGSLTIPRFCIICFHENKELWK